MHPGGGVNGQGGAFAQAVKADHVVDARGLPVRFVLTLGQNGTEFEWRIEHPQHSVTIAQAFATGRYEVIFEEWDFLPLTLCSLASSGRYGTVTPIGALTTL